MYRYGELPYGLLEDASPRRSRFQGVGAPDFDPIPELFAYRPLPLKPVMLTIPEPEPPKYYTPPFRPILNLPLPEPDFHPLAPRVKEWVNVLNPVVGTCRKCGHRGFMDDPCIGLL